MSSLEKFLQKNPSVPLGGLSALAGGLFFGLPGAAVGGLLGAGLSPEIIKNLQQKQPTAQQVFMDVFEKGRVLPANERREYYIQELRKHFGGAPDELVQQEAKNFLERSLLNRRTPTVNIKGLNLKDPIQKKLYNKYYNEALKEQFEGAITERALAAAKTRYRANFFGKPLYVQYPSWLRTLGLIGDKEHRKDIARYFPEGLPNYPTIRKQEAALEKLKRLPPEEMISKLKEMEQQGIVGLLDRMKHQIDLENLRVTSVLSPAGKVMASKIPTDLLGYARARAQPYMGNLTTTDKVFTGLDAAYGKSLLKAWNRAHGQVSLGGLVPGTWSKGLANTLKTLKMPSNFSQLGKLGKTWNVLKGGGRFLGRIAGPVGAAYTFKDLYDKLMTGSEFEPLPSGTEMTKRYGP